MENDALVVRLINLSISLSNKYLRINYTTSYISYIHGECLTRCRGSYWHTR